MHSFGVTNGSNEEQPSSSQENGVFSNGDVQNGTGTSNGNAGNISNGTEANGINSNKYTNGSGGGHKDDDDEDDGLSDDLDGPYMNGNSHKPPKKETTFVARSSIEFEIIRLIGQQLDIMGLNQTVEQLIKESGCRLDHHIAAEFRSHVMKGEWVKADATLKELKAYLDNPKHLTKMKFLLLEQKFLECIEDGKEIDALKCLQNEITQLKYNMDKLPIICSYLFTNSIEELKRVANWEGKGKVSRSKLMEKLQNFLPATIMLPPRRLQSLLNQAIELQKERCPYHNFKTENGLNEFSLLVDHQCSKDDLPSETVQTLTEHKEEVWFCRFSNDGTRLATGSKEGIIAIWNIDPETFQLSLKYTLVAKANSSNQGVGYFSWSPDDHYLLSLGTEECSEFWIWDTLTGTLKIHSCQSTEDSLTACAWHKDSKKFVVGGQRGQFYQIDLTGAVLDNWEGVRVQCLAYKKDGKTILAADTHHRIRGYNFAELTDFNVLKEDHSIMSFTCDETGRLALINIENQGIHLWDIEDRVLLRKFQGNTQGFFTNYSCFGGVDQLFVASGSEDNKVIIWHIKREHPISILKGHTRAVNCVHWNPRYPHMLASASDDTTVRIWSAKHRRHVMINETKNDPAANKSISTNNDNSSTTTNNNNNNNSTSNSSQTRVNNGNTSDTSNSNISIHPPSSSSSLSLNSIRHVSSSTSTSQSESFGNFIVNLGGNGTSCPGYRSSSVSTRISSNSPQLSTISLIHHAPIINIPRNSFNPMTSNNSSSNSQIQSTSNSSNNNNSNASSSSSSCTNNSSSGVSRRNALALFVASEIQLAQRPEQSQSQPQQPPPTTTTTTAAAMNTNSNVEQQQQQQPEPPIATQNQSHNQSPQQQQPQPQGSSSGATSDESSSSSTTSPSSSGSSNIAKI